MKGSRVGAGEEKSRDRYFFAVETNKLLEWPVERK